ncbi:MAG TPA: 30S ribosomal protein S17 [Thermoplasmata archaeon]|uniref:Small ribosomal subunit protein uS17 n=1 Tax=uncultured euryarchaeote Rifle_16ft_4_minimus_37789 TaxID=1665195 RepID=A0A0H4T821_9EURY|nr:30S ribosomal protein S17, small subunit ribosomal protein S17 [uncultured euryarchaeote Rifle_16ft_4_minimus_37789]HKZ63684.1 30S ribosomal protein S17 [Thermoplasmata archaeon]
MAKERGGEPTAASGRRDERPAPARKPTEKPPPREDVGKTATATRDIGVDVPKPGRGCEDPHCPFHGTLPVRGQTFEGRVVSTRMLRTAIVERDYLRYIRKFERYEKRTKRFHVHSPPCLDLKVGDRVALMECRPIAKTVSFVAIQNRGAAA